MTDSSAMATTYKTITMLQGSTYTVSLDDFGMSEYYTIENITAAPTTGVLAFRGDALTTGNQTDYYSVAHNQVTFTATTAGIAASTLTVERTHEWDPAGFYTLTFNVTPVNHAPLGTDKTVATVKDKPYAFSMSDFGFSDPNDTTANALNAVEITTLPTVGVLTDSGNAVTPGQFVSAADISGGKLLFTRANTIGESAASFTFQVQDNGGTANGGVDLAVAPNTLTLNGPSVNKAPSGADTSVRTLEDTPYIFKTADFGFSDANDSPANALKAVEISGVPLFGILTDGGTAVVAGQFVSAADIAAGKLQFVPAANSNETTDPFALSNVSRANDFVSFQVQDDGGTANGGVDLDPTRHYATVFVTSVNDAPSGADKAVTTLENKSYTFSVDDFGFSDPNDTKAASSGKGFFSFSNPGSPGNVLKAVEITTLPTSGTLLDNGTVVQAGQFVSAADIATGLLKYAPAMHVSGPASFAFQVQDDGGTANGGVDTDPTARTLTVDVTPVVNQAPSGADKTVRPEKGHAYTFTTADFGFTDANTPADALLAVKITTLPTAGTLSDDGVAITSTRFVSTADIAAGALVYTPLATTGSSSSTSSPLVLSPYYFGVGSTGLSTADVNGPNYAALAPRTSSFTFQVQDDGGTDNGGVDLDASPNTMSVGIARSNDFDGNGVSDVLYRSSTSGVFGYEALTSAGERPWVFGGPSDASYAIVGKGDFTGDGVSGVLFRNSAGLMGYDMLGASGGLTYTPIGQTNPDYSVAGVGDFNGDGVSDILFRNNATGDMGYDTLTSSGQTYHAIGSSNPVYSVAGIGDFNGDGVSDILFRNNATGDMGYDTVNAGGGQTYHSIGTSGTAYSVAGIGDFNGHGVSDILYRNNLTGDMGYSSIAADVQTYHATGSTNAAYSVVDVGNYTGGSLSNVLFRNNATGDQGFDVLTSVGQSYHALGASDPGYKVA